MATFDESRSPAEPPSLTRLCPETRRRAALAGLGLFACIAAEAGVAPALRAADSWFAGLVAALEKEL